MNSDTGAAESSNRGVPQLGPSQGGTSELLTVEQTLRLVFGRTDAFRVLWNIYIVVTLGVIGFIANVGTKPSGRMVSWLAAAGFLVFALSNMAALLQTQTERRGLVEVLDSLNPPGQYGTLRSAVGGLRSWVIPAFHLLMDAGVVTCILLLGRRGV